MKKYKLGELIKKVDGNKNKQLKDLPLLGINIDKEFMPSVANTIGTDMSNYQIVKKEQFACNPMHLGRDERMPTALLLLKEEILVSPAYFVFEIIDKNIVLPEYLMLYFKRSETDRLLWFKTDSSVRGGLGWDELCAVEIMLPSIEKQQKIIAQYNQINTAIKIKEKLNNNLEQQLLTIFKSKFITFEEYGGEKPMGWLSGNFAQLIENTKGGDWGKSEPTGNYTEEVLCIRGTDIPSIVNSGCADIPKRYILSKNLKDRNLSSGDLVVEISGGSPIQSTGRIALITPYLKEKYGMDIICTNFCRALKPIEEYSRFIYYYWVYLYKKDLFFTYENSTIGLKNLDIEGFLNNEVITIPDKDSASKFSILCQSYEKSMFTNGLACEQLKKLKVSLLPKLMLENS